MTVFKLSNIKVPIKELEKPLMEIVQKQFPFEIKASHGWELKGRSMICMERSGIVCVRPEDQFPEGLQIFKISNF